MGKIGSAIDTSQGRARPLALVVDNERMTRRLVREALEQSGLDVREAESGAQAIELFGSDRPDIVLVEVGMPGMDGFTICSALRGLFGGSWIPILLMTGVDDAESVAKAYEQGATDFITKPANSTILCHRVWYLLRGSSTLNALLKSETRLGLAQRIAKIGNWEWHPPTNQFIGSHESFRLIGMRQQDFGGTLEAFLDTVHPDDRNQIETALKGMVTHRTACDIDIRLVLPTGADFTVNVQAEVVHDDRIKSYSIVGTIQDISERKRSEREIHRLAYFDSLTGLPNRVLFKDRVTQALAHAKRYHTIFATLFLDLDRFKVINDTLGHNVGDLLLKSFADRLADSIRHSDSAGRDVVSEPEQTLARLGGDEFTVLLTNLADVQDAGKVARRILDELAQPFSIEGREIFVTVSVGIAIYPADGESVDALLKNSDSAMYHAKEQGQNNYQFYSNSMNAAAGARLALEGELRHAIERNELVVYYQPKVDLLTAAIVGAEALVRWQHAQQGLLLPDAFMPAAIDTGLIREIDEWVIRTVCRQQCMWQEAGLSLVCVSVNVSNSLFHGSTLVAVVEESLHQTGLYARWLELELTESIVMRNVDASIAMLRRLNEMGVQLSIDDFGTGYSSLSYLQRLPLDMVKIDQSFIRDIVTQAEPASIVRAIIAMSHSLELEVLAEGVEEEAQRKVLLEQRCDHAQGYLFGRPMPEEEFATWLSRIDLREAS